MAFLFFQILSVFPDYYLATFSFMWVGKKMKKQFYILILFLFHIGPDFGQSVLLDSLINTLQTTKEDSVKVKILNDLFIEYEFDNRSHAKEYLDQALELSQKINYSKGLASTYTHLGFFAEDAGNYKEAIIDHETSLKISKILKDEKSIASSYNNLGNIFSQEGNYAEALKKYFASLKIREAINRSTNQSGSKKDIAVTYNNIGSVYSNQGNYMEALKQFSASLKIRIDLNDQAGIAASYNNIGTVYYSQTDQEPDSALRGIKLNKALENYLASLKIREELNDKKGISNCFHNIGNVYFAQAEKESIASLRSKKLGEALKNYFASLKIREAIGNKAGIAISYSNIGNVYTKQKKYNKAESYLIKARDLSKETGYKEYIKATFKNLVNLDSTLAASAETPSQKKAQYWIKAYENHKLYILYRDSIDNEETRKKIIQSQMTYDFEKKEAIAVAEHKKELENQQLLADEKSHKQKTVLLLVLISLLLVILFAGFIFRSLKITRKQKDIIVEQKNIVENQKQIVEQQKQLVEEKQKEIIDSITYARRIQRSLLPSEKYIDRTFKRLMK
jgi:tetratricopeptide (TPR) repeat protein